MSTPAHRSTLDAVADTLGLPRDAAFRPLGHGTGHQAFAIGDLVVRIDLADDAERSIRVVREARLLAEVASISPLAVPEVAASRPDLGVIVVRRLPGVSALDRRPTAPEAIAAQLAEFVAALARIDRRDVAGLVHVDDAPPDAYLAELIPRADAVRAELTAQQRRALDAFLGSPPPPPANLAVFCHHDLGAEHILLDENGRTVTGVIDWSDAAITDPAHDLGRVLRDFGAAVAGACQQSLALDDGGIVDRILFHARCSLIEDLAYGVDEGDRRYANAALRSFARLFSPNPLG